jgi:hypothetical protein
MNRLSLPVVLALALSTSIGFACGYVFYSAFGEARTAAAQAVFGAQEAQRVFQTYETILITAKFHRELTDIKTIQDVEALRLKYREATLKNIDFFEKQAGQLALPMERTLVSQLLESAEKTRKEIEKKAGQD